MNRFLVLAFLIAVVTSSDVIILNEKNFDEFINPQTPDIWFIRFFAPWCGHCKSMITAWEETATNLKGIARVANVDATVERQLASLYQIRGYPTLYLFYNNEVYEYAGKRDSKTLTNFVLDVKSEIESGKKPSKSCSFKMNFAPVKSERGIISNVQRVIVTNFPRSKKTISSGTKVRIFAWQWIVLSLVVIVAIVLIRHVMIDNRFEDQDISLADEKLSLLEGGYHSKDI